MSDHVARPASDLLKPTLGSLQVVADPTAGMGLALGADGRIPVSAPATSVVAVASDPVSPVTGQIWYRTDTNQLSIKTAAGVKRSAAFT